MKNEKEREYESLRMEMYYRERRKEHRIVFDQPNGHELEGLLESMTMSSGSDLVAYIENARWLLDADLRIRQIALGAIDDAIVKMRMENGLPPFNDSLLGEKPTAFEIVRQILRVNA